MLRSHFGSERGGLLDLVLLVAFGVDIGVFFVVLRGDRREDILGVVKSIRAAVVERLQTTTVRHIGLVTVRIGESRDERPHIDRGVFESFIRRLGDKSRSDLSSVNCRFDELVRGVRRKPLSEEAFVSERLSIEVDLVVRQPCDLLLKLLSNTFEIEKRLREHILHIVVHIHSFLILRLGVPNRLPTATNSSDERILFGVVHARSDTNTRRLVVGSLQRDTVGVNLTIRSRRTSHEFIRTEQEVHHELVSVRPTFSPHDIIQILLLQNSHQNVHNTLVIHQIESLTDRRNLFESVCRHNHLPLVRQRELGQILSLSIAVSDIHETVVPNLFLIPRLERAEVLTDRSPPRDPRFISLSSLNPVQLGGDGVSNHYTSLLPPYYNKGFDYSRIPSPSTGIFA